MAGTRKDGLRPCARKSPLSGRSPGRRGAIPHDRSGTAARPTCVLSLRNRSFARSGPVRRRQRSKGPTDHWRAAERTGAIAPTPTWCASSSETSAASSATRPAPSSSSASAASDSAWPDRGELRAAATPSAPKDAPRAGAPPRLQSSRAQPVRLRRRGRPALRRPRVQVRPAIPHPVAEAVEARRGDPRGHRDTAGHGIPDALPRNPAPGRTHRR